MCIRDRNTPVVDETPDNSTENNVTNADENFMAAVETAIYNKVNEERTKAGVPTLTYNTVMQKYARIKSQDMGDNNYFSHEDLNGNLITTQMKKDGVSYKAWGENIAYIGGNISADALAERFMTNWMNSSGHRENILSTNFSSIGCLLYTSYQMLIMKVQLTLKQEKKWLMHLVWQVWHSVMHS